MFLFQRTCVVNTLLVLVTIFLIVSVLITLTSQHCGSLFDSRYWHVVSGVQIRWVGFLVWGCGGYTVASKSKTTGTPPSVPTKDLW